MAAPRATLGTTDGGEGESVLVLGAGLVAGPALEMLSRPTGRKVVIVSGVEGEAEARGEERSASSVSRLGSGGVS